MRPIPRRSECRAGARPEEEEIGLSREFIDPIGLSRICMQTGLRLFAILAGTLARHPSPAFKIAHQRKPKSDDARYRQSRCRWRFLMKPGPNHQLHAQGIFRGIERHFTITRCRLPNGYIWGATAWKFCGVLYERIYLAMNPSGIDRSRNFL